MLGWRGVSVSHHQAHVPQRGLVWDQSYISKALLIRHIFVNTRAIVMVRLTAASEFAYHQYSDSRILVFPIPTPQMNLNSFQRDPTRQVFQGCLAKTRTDTCILLIRLSYALYYSGGIRRVSIPISQIHLLLLYAVRLSSSRSTNSLSLLTHSQATKIHIL